MTKILWNQRFYKKLLKKWFHEIFFRRERISRFSALCKSIIIPLFYFFQQKFREINSFPNCMHGLDVNWFHEIFSKCVWILRFFPLCTHCNLKLPMLFLTKSFVLTSKINFTKKWQNLSKVLVLQHDHMLLWTKC